jgi:hypothetical protein
MYCAEVVKDVIYRGSCEEESFRSEHGASGVLYVSTL